MFKIKTLNSIAPVWQSILPATDYVVGTEDADYDAVIVRSADMHGMETPDSLLCVARAGAGVNNIPLDEMAAKGVVVFNTPGANANAVKELTLLGLFLACRKVSEGIAWASTLKGQGDAVGKLVEKGKSQFVGPELLGKTLGVVGLGGIGVLVANAAASLGMNVMGYDPYISINNAWRLSRAVHQAATQADLLAASDFVTIHVPLTNDTKGSFGAEQFAQMKKGAALLNFSRGEIVDTAALLAALQDGTIRRYVTDFPSDAVLGVDGVVAIPHLGASTPESENNCVDMAAREVDAYLKTGAITHSVNYPDTQLPPVFRHRIVVLHANVPNMVGQITSAVASAHINIDSMVNRSKGQFAVSVLDPDDQPTEAVIQAISALNGVYRVRVL